MAISAGESALIDEQGAYIGPTNPLPVATAIPVFKAESGFASVAGSSFQTVLSFTPTVQIEVIGYNCDFAALLDAAYRMQMSVGGTVVHAEKVTSNTNSWTPLRLSVAADTAVLIEIFHSEATAQDARATLNYQEV